MKDLRVRSKVGIKLIIMNQILFRGKMMKKCYKLYTRGKAIPK